MKKELISEAVSNIKEEYITEAQTPPTANRPWQRKLVAAVVALCLLAGGLWALSPSGAMNVTAYAVDSNQPITANGVVLDTGTISDSGEMTCHPLLFCLDGAEMKSVRFSCKNQELDYRDCTEQRDEYGQAQNFVVEYGPNTDEYPALLIDWVPDKTIRALTDNEDMTIAKLPEELRVGRDRPGRSPTPTTRLIPKPLPSPFRTAASFLPSSWTTKSRTQIPSFGVPMQKLSPEQSCMRRGRGMTA